MPGTNRRVFISHSHADNRRCEPLLAALDAWKTDYWFDTQELNPGQQLTDRLQQAIAERDVFIRICTPACQQSYWTEQELLAFRGLQQHQGHGRRTLIFLIMDPGYALEPVAEGDVVINAATRTQAEWMRDLRQTLGIAEIAKAMNRRAFLGLGIAGAATVASVGTAAAVLIRGRGQSGGQAELLVPSVHQPTPTPLANAQRVLWYQEFSNGSGLYGSSVPEVAVSNGVVFVAAGQGIYALNGKDGSLIWRTEKATGTAGASTPAVVGDRLYLVGNDPATLNFGATAICLSVADGARVWATALSPLSVSAPTVTDAGVFLSAGDGNVYALDPATGAHKWTTRIGGTGVGSSAPAVAGGRTFVGSDDGALHALDTTSGQPLWAYQAGPGGTLSTGVHSSPLVLDGVVYFGAQDGNVYALNAGDGSVRWSYSGGKYHEFDMAPVIDNDVLYIGETVEGAFVALDAAGGSVRWQQSYPSSPGSRINLTPSGDRVAISESAFYCTVGDSLSGCYLLAADKKSGTELWRMALPQAGSSTMTAPIFEGGVVYFGSADGAVYAVTTAGA